MKTHYNHLVLFSAVLIAWMMPSCSESEKQQDVPVETKTVTYTESTDDFPNPERGFYRYSETRASNYSPLVKSQLEAWRGLQQADGGNYQVYSTLVFRYFVLDVFKTTPLSQTFLDAVANDLAIARSAGVKLIARFVYTTSVTSGACPEGFICPPYGDASKATVLGHIAQLKPVLTAGADVIAVVQLGLIGVWGENYYTDHFGDASQNGQSKLLDQNWLDRNEIIAAMLDALPKDRMVQVRYPQIKQRFIYGINAGVTVAPLAESEAFTGSDKSRLGFHNDCFLASPDDYGTYEDYGNSNSPRQSANTVLRQYFKSDSKFVAVGGETCDDAFSPQNDCEPAGRAETEMAEMHYSYLNCAYNNSVNNDWQTGGCMNAIKKKLGYRFVLKEFTHSKEVKAGESLSFKVKIRNEGYAAPFNPRSASLMLIKSGTSSGFGTAIATDIRNWFTGDILIEGTIDIGTTTEPGTYDLYLYLPDKAPSLANRPEYCIRFANTGVWNAALGYNSLNTSVVVR